MSKIGVGFDFDHTLGIDNGLEIYAFGRLAEELGSPIDIAEPHQHAAIEALMVPFRAAQEPMARMMLRFAGILAPNPRTVDVNGDALAARFRRICYDLVNELVHPIPGAVECIAELAAGGTPIGILTNGWSELQERKIARALGDFPGPILVSDTLGACKPSAAAFRMLEEALGVAPADLWYVGDSPAADIDGARAYGLRAVWLNREGHAYPPGLAEPTAQIEHLDALPALVRGA
jgi:HAD superfamily hydrolase (TIGR01509 family)